MLIIVGLGLVLGTALYTHSRCSTPRAVAALRDGVVLDGRRAARTRPRSVVARRPARAGDRSRRGDDRGGVAMKLALRELRRRPGRFVTATIILTLVAMLVMFLGGLLDGLIRGATDACGPRRPTSSCSPTTPQRRSCAAASTPTRARRSKRSPASRDRRHRRRAARRAGAGQRSP